ncbi:hypothetical protein Tco_0706406 [Tanacetum coccineum]|uniref:Uncharacterized protein n=1 Tax=Tanacetum coccineum TaxID=301880 RepID=A0ABQ4Y860_9ASTR
MISSSLIQIAESCVFISRMHEEANTARNLVGQLNALIAEIEALEDQGEVFNTLMDLRDDKEAVRTKLKGLNELITYADSRDSRPKKHDSCAERIDLWFGFQKCAGNDIYCSIHKDKAIWRCNNGSLKDYSTKQVWGDYKVQHPKVDWRSLVCSYHAFVLMKKDLQDGYRLGKSNSNKEREEIKTPSLESGADLMHFFLKGWLVGLCLGQESVSFCLDLVLGVFILGRTVEFKFLRTLEFSWYGSILNILQGRNELLEKIIRIMETEANDLDHLVNYDNDNDIDDLGYESRFYPEEVWVQKQRTTVDEITVRKGRLCKESIQKTNGLATVEKEMETRETVNSAGSKKRTKSLRKESSRQHSQSQENVSPLLVLPQELEKRRKLEEVQREKQERENG